MGRSCGFCAMARFGLSSLLWELEGGEVAAREGVVVPVRG
jgi:hypothetical protein